MTPTQRAVGATTKVTDDFTVDDVCALLNRINLGHCVQAITKNKVNGRELLRCRQSEFIRFLKAEGMLAFKARAAWEQLYPYVKPAAGHAKYIVRALVVGMDDYSGGGLPPLKNSVKDALAIADILKGAGVNVTVKLNLPIDEFKAATNEHIASLNEGDISMLFYAGHGHMLKNMQRLVAIPKGDKPDFAKDALSVEVLAIKMSRRKTKANIFFLDCCRSFKYAETRGTAPIAVGANVISFACSPNHEAYDGAEVGHGLYTQCLIRHLLTPGIDILEMLQRVGEELIALAASMGCKQRSYYTSSLNHKLVVFQ